jgi:hypothetical protein
MPHTRALPRPARLNDRLKIPSRSSGFPARDLLFAPGPGSTEERGFPDCVPHAKTRSREGKRNEWPVASEASRGWDGCRHAAASMPHTRHCRARLAKRVLAERGPPRDGETTAIREFRGDFHLSEQRELSVGFGSESAGGSFDGAKRDYLGA